MNSNASGLSSGNQVSTYHENRTGAKVNQRRPNFPCVLNKSKPELIGLIESQCWDLLKKDQEIERLWELLEEIGKDAKAAQERDYYKEKYRALQVKYASLQADCINRFQDRNEVQMKIAG